MSGGALQRLGLAGGEASATNPASPTILLPQDLAVSRGKGYKSRLLDGLPRRKPLRSPRSLHPRPARRASQVTRGMRREAAVTRGIVPHRRHPLDHRHVHRARGQPMRLSSPCRSLHCARMAPSTGSRAPPRPHARGKFRPLRRRSRRLAHPTPRRRHHALIDSERRPNAPETSRFTPPQVFVASHPTSFVDGIR